MTDLARLGPLLALAALVAGAGCGLLAFALLYWTARDVAARTRSTAARIAALLLVLVFNVLGLVVYVLVRPRLTLAERQERAIIEGLLAREVTAAVMARGSATMPGAPRGAGGAADGETASGAAARRPTIVGPPPR